MQLSLSYTMADLDDILPPGSYKLDLVDRAGMPLGVTIDVEIGGLRNAAASESQDLDDGPISLSSGAGDVRYVLEANVRSTQLAFQHNQRTLEAPTWRRKWLTKPSCWMGRRPSGCPTALGRVWAERRSRKRNRPLSRPVRWWR
jgi:hypothetical protein